MRRAGTEAAGPAIGADDHDNKKERHRWLAPSNDHGSTADRAPGDRRHHGARHGALAAAGDHQAGIGADPIRVGVISPLTGAWTVYGKAHSAGFQMAVDEINEKGGVLGRPIEIVLRRLQDRAQDRGRAGEPPDPPGRVDFLAGTFSSAERNAAGPVVTSANKILLYPTFYEGQEKEYYPGCATRTSSCSARSRLSRSGRTCST